MGEGSRVIIYARVSTEEQGKRGYSLQDQVERCKKFCELRNWTVYRVYTEVHSGRKGKRTKFEEAVQLVMSGIAEGIVTAYLDRLTRNLRTFVELCEQFTKHDKFFTTVDGFVDLTTPAGRLMANVVMAFKQYEAEDRGEKTSRGLRRAKAAGKQIGWKKGRPRLPEWKRQRIIKDFVEKGITYQNAEVLHVSKDTIYKVLKDEGLYR